MYLLSHSWDMSPQDARKLQEKLAPLVIREQRLVKVGTVAGIPETTREAHRLAEKCKK
jgi:hypothetical protein